MTEEHAEMILEAQKKVLLSITLTMRSLVLLNKLTEDMPDANNLAFHLTDYAKQLVDHMESGKFIA